MHLLADHHLGLNHLLLIVWLLDGVSPISFLTERTVVYLYCTCCWREQKETI